MVHNNFNAVESGIIPDRIADLIFSMDGSYFCNYSSMYISLHVMPLRLFVIVGAIHKTCWAEAQEEWIVRFEDPGSQVSCKPAIYF